MSKLYTVAEISGKAIPVTVLCAVLLLPAIVLSSCVAAPPPTQDPAFRADAPVALDAQVPFAEVESTEWILLSVRRGVDTVFIDREVDLFGLGDIFTINFDDGRVSGMGAPNRFFGPYAPSADGSLRIGTEDGALASTLMMPLFEPEELREHEFFAYLSRVTRWDIREGKLELHTSSVDESEVVLVFVR